MVVGVALQDALEDLRHAGIGVGAGEDQRAVADLEDVGAARRRSR